MHQHFHFFCAKSNYHYAREDLCDPIPSSWCLICALVRYFSMIFSIKTRVWDTLSGIEFDSLHFEGSQKFIRLPRLLDVLKNCETAVYEAAGVFENHRFSQTLGGCSPSLARH